jgi:hypothetical protein
MRSSLSLGAGASPVTGEADRRKMIKLRVPLSHTKVKSKGGGGLCESAFQIQAPRRSKLAKVWTFEWGGLQQCRSRGSILFWKK